MHSLAIHLANGGVETVEGSLMAKNGARIALTRQDDYGKMQESQIKFAEAVSKGEPCPKDGAAFVIIMGDGYSAYASGIGESMAGQSDRASPQRRHSLDRCTGGGVGHPAPPQPARNLCGIRQMQFNRRDTEDAEIRGRENG